MIIMNDVVLTCTENEFNDIEDGKTVTIRKGYRPIRLEELRFESLVKKRVMTVKVIHVVHAIVQDVPMDFVKNDLFTDKHDLVNQLRQFYPDIDENTEVTIVNYK